MLVPLLFYKPMQKKILSWFDQNKRILPWREQRSPYHVWISEIMLQQTRVETVIPYYQRWMALFPDLATLAAADEQSVLKMWEGLGYYSRARSLHKAAGIIFHEMGGVFPSDPKEIQKLPGVGRYTAGAIASIAFSQPVAALDGNIRRIYARIGDVALPARSTEGERLLWQMAEELLDQERPGDYNEALMDLGSLICIPLRPLCASCPVAADCLAFRNGTVAERPVVIPPKAIPHYVVTAAVIRRMGTDGVAQYLLAQRPDNGLLAGLWEFPGGKIEDGETLEECLRREIREELAADVIIKAPFGTYKHAYTHFRVTLNAFICEIDRDPQPLAAQALRWAAASELDQFPMGKIDRQIARRILSEELDGDQEENGMEID